MSPIRFSIIVATFNPGSVLLRCLESIINQTYPDVELIVIDGGSTDESINIIRSHANRIDYFESKPDRGIAHAWNKGLSHATGNWVLFLGADDHLWEKNSLEKITPVLSSLSEATQVAYTCVAALDESGKQCDLLGREWHRHNFLHGGMYFSHQGVFHRRALFSQYGMFDESFRLAPDYELLLRCLKDRDPVFIPNVTVAAMQLGGVSNSPINTLSTIKEFSKARKKHHISDSLAIHYKALINAYGKLFLRNVLGDKWTAKCIKWKRTIFQ